ncbi:MAG: beta-glucosidase BglX [Flavobacteriaceae bacterium]|nr:beta-glucosidase BglX [Flavobacteriaceae bacterium]|tara:strand:- start:925 stop:3225 length:2301 start_codon:yes stop_codon:yes gene_type:complete
MIIEFNIIKKHTIILLIIISFFACNSDNSSFSNDIIDKKVDSLLNIMTLDEKIGQMNQYNGFWDITGPSPKNGQAKNKYQNLKNGLVGSMLNVRGVDEITALQKIAVEETRLGIPLIIGNDVIHGYKTISPIPLAEAASWDLKEIENSAKIAAIEASAAGTNWTFAPMVDISRDARWGRVMEGAGEDPFLGSLIAVARIKGFQGEDLSKHNTIAATAKHLAAYGFSESGKDYNTVDISKNTLYNIVFPPFIASINQGVKSVMNSFNELDGIPATGNFFLQRTLLKGEWNFDGFVVSDWGSIREMIPHGYARDADHATEIAIEAGSDMDMESNLYVNKLKKLVELGKVDISLINDAVSRILRVKFELGLFDDPYRYLNSKREKELINHPNHHKAVLEMAKKSIVLLKNENQLLPLKKTNQSIALIGALANDNNSPLGNWRPSSDNNTAVTVLDGMKKYPNNKLIYKKGADVILNKGGVVKFAEKIMINENDKSGFNAARIAARTADVVVMVLGEDGFQSGEGRSRAQIDIPGVQQELLEEIFKINKNIVLVLMNGRPLNINWADKNIPAIVEAWQLGSQTGNAIAQVLYGDYNPSGKLPMSFPRSVGQIPIYYNHKNTGRPGPKNIVFWSHYNDELNSPLYPFGYGLSYTTFNYSNLKMDSKVLNFKSSINISVDIQNTGNFKGKEVVQLYIKDRFASVTRPIKELKGFDLVELDIGETKTIKFQINESLLRFYSKNEVWESEPGFFDFYIGTDSNATLKNSFELIK